MTEPGDDAMGFSFARMLPWFMLTSIANFLFMPPYAEQGWSVLQPFVWVAPIVIFSKLAVRRAFASGLLLGTLANVLIFEWLVETLRRFTEIPIVGVYAFVFLYSLVAGLVIAVFAAGVGPLRRSSGVAWPFVIAAWMVTCEHWIPQFFPYSQGAAWIGYPSVYLLAAHTGTAGVGFLVFLVAGQLVVAFEAMTGKPPRNVGGSCWSAGGAIALIVLSLGVAAHQEARITRAERDAPSFRVAMLQDNLERTESRRRFKGNPVGVAERLVLLSENAIRDDELFDVVMWSEGALRSAPDRSWGKPARDFTRRTGVELWTGAITEIRTDGVRSWYNSVYQIRDGGVSKPYHKNHLVPISERLPFADWLPSLHWLTGASEGTGMFTAGTEPGVVETRWARVGLVICYEAILSEPMLETVRGGADLLANFTYEGWFGNTRELDLHLLMAQGQAAQLGVPMVRAATTGITAFIDARGQVTRRSGRFTEEVIVDDVRPLRATGLYAAFGPWFAWMCSLACAPLIVRGRVVSTSTLDSG